MINLTDEILPVLNSNASKIQRMVRNKQQQRRIQDQRRRQIYEQQFDQNHSNILNENEARINELDNVLRQDSASRKLQSIMKRKLTQQQQKKDNAATTIQSAFRNSKATNKLIELAKNKEKENAALMIQTNYRRHKGEKDFIDSAAKKIISDKKKDNAATKLSKVMRGHKERQIYKYLKDDYPKIKAKYKELVSNTQPSTSLQTEPITLTPSQQSAYEQELLASRTRASQLYEQALQRHNPSTNLQTGEQPVIPTTRKQQQYKDLIKSGNIETAANQRLARIQNKTNQTQQITNAIKAIKTKNDAAVKIQSAVRNRNALKKLYKLEDRDKAMEAAINKYNGIGEMMASRNENPIVSNEAAGNRFIQSAARLRKKALQSKISDLRTRSALPQSQTRGIIQEANLGINRMDNIIQKKTRGRQPTTGAAATTRLSTTSRLSTASTLGQQTPAKRK
jgi:hypothetical protein